MKMSQECQTRLDTYEKHQAIFSKTFHERIFISVFTTRSIKRAKQRMRPIMSQCLRSIDLLIPACVVAIVAFSKRYQRYKNTIFSRFTPIRYVPFHAANHIKRKSNCASFTVVVFMLCYIYNTNLFCGRKIALVTRLILFMIEKCSTTTLYQKLQ